MSEKNEKDFLSQFSSENKPKSFQEEERIPVQNSFQPNWKLIGGLAAVALVALAAVWFFFLRPKIVMPDFVGKNQSEVAAWVRQQGIDSSGIIMKGEYSLDYDENVIMTQSVKEGTKVKEDVKIDFTVSKGADPDEKISVPDIANMTKDELNDWVKKNKLQKVKITTAYSETVPNGEVINYEFKGVEADSFTRGSTLNISVSKGPAPAGTVTVPEFTSKEQAENWGKTNKITVQIIESFNNDKLEGYVVDQNPKKDQTVKTGDTVTVYISKGKGVMVPDLVSMNKTQAEEWLAQYPVVTKQRYSNTTHHIVSQSLPAGTMVSESELYKMEVVVNLGSTFYAEDAGITLIGNDFDRLVDKLNDLRPQGIDAYTDNWTAGNEVYSETYNRGQIISVQCTGYSDNKVYACDGPLPLDARFDVVISKGKVTPIDEEGTVTELMDELTKVVSFKLDSNITADRYGYPAKVVNADGSSLSDGKVYEDKEYRIVLTGGAPTPEPTPTPTPDPTPEPPVGTSIKVYGTVVELKNQLQGNVAGFTVEGGLNNSDDAKVVNEDGSDLEGNQVFSDKKYQIVADN
ncbi:MAG: PASTA domain-containing protein [Erysipelotrichaceae bacterium]|nr:PASTA domain-containing protein [Erysipelotrichaceae bacterium]